MMIMAQHPQQQQQQQHYTSDPQKQPAPVGSKFQPNQIMANSNNGQQQQQQHHNRHQQEQDGKRTLIKNQLYLIEQLQLENANLRNERDQLQLENEELKFQLQMISSSNILNQPGATFDNQQLERLVESDGKINENHHNNHHSPINLRAANGPTATPSTANQGAPTANQQLKLLATPIRQSMKLIGLESQQQRPPVSSAIVDQQLSVRPAASTATDGKQLDAIETTFVSSSNTAIPSLQTTTINSNKFLAGKSTSLSAFSVKTSLAPQSRNLPHDDEEQRVKLVEQRYGDREQVQAAAIIIQRAFRKYQICKRFRTITEQLRHTYQSVNQPERKRLDAGSVKPTPAPQNKSILSSSSKAPEVPCASGTTRAAAWESLSYAASRLAASAAATTAAAAAAAALTAPTQSGPKQQHITISTNGVTKQVSSQQVAVAADNRQSKQDPVVAAAINFQQLESIRKRQYRVGLNIFNKNPEKGVSFLVAHSFIDSSSPYTKTSSSYYHSNQLHFIDTHQHLAQQQQQTSPSTTTNMQSCQLCCEEDNLKRNVAHFLLHRKGLAKEKIGQYLGNLQAQFNQSVLKYYLQELDFYGLQIDLALRKFLSTFRLPGEAQKIERIVDCFAQRYVQCQQQQQSNVSNTNIARMQQQQQSQMQQPHQTPQQQIQNQQSNYKNNLMLLSKDEIFILTFAIIMLNTDLHSPSLKPTSRMSSVQFVNNLRGVFKSQSINEGDLIEIYERVKANQITTTPDHVTHVMKVQQGLTVTNFQKKELPNLCVPHRRLVCFCRLFEVYDVNKKERVGQHQREIFLFNDLLLITKLARRVRANTTQLYTYRQSISLQGLYVQLFQSAHYNFGIRLCQRSNDETLIMFNARNELDQSRFVDDLGESIAEMDEMETIKAHNIIETIHFKYLERLRTHAMMHNVTNENIQSANNHIVDDNQQGNKIVLNMINNCDTRDSSSKQIIEHQESRMQENTDSNGGTATSSSGVGRAQTKFSSMLNLSSVANGKVTTHNADQSKAKDEPALKQNQSFVHQPQRMIDQLGGGRNDPAGVQRRCSTSSVHSLDSGLFLSRDVSPNQSS